jgi:heptosyltransferase I
LIFQKQPSSNEALLRLKAEIGTRVAMLQILIIQPSSFADIVHALQVVTSLKEQRRDVKISWIVRDIFAPFVRSAEAVDQVFVFRRQGGVLAFLKMMREVRRTQYDYVFDMQGYLRTGLMTFRTRAVKKVGRSDAREGANAFYDLKVPLPPAGKRAHLLEKLLQFAPVVDAKPELQGTLSFREVGGLNLSHLEGRLGVKPIVMFPDSRRENKRWPGYKQLTELLLREDRRRRVVWAGQNYVPDKDAFLADQFLNLTGNTSIVSLPALLRRALWVISNENGPMHLAAALNIPVLGIFGPSDPQICGPYPLRGPTNYVVQAPVGDLRLLSAKEVFGRFRRIAGGVYA